MSKKDKKLIAFLIVISLIWPIYLIVNRADEPMAAAEMSAEERGENDSAVLMEELAPQNIVDDVEIDYDYKSISVYLDILRSQQYASNTADDIEDAVDEALDDRRGDLTIEESYSVYVYDQKGRRIN